MTPNHPRKSRVPGVDESTVDAAGIRFVEANIALELCGISQAGRIFRYRNLDGSDVLDDDKAFVRLRLSKPLGKMKYFQRKGSRPHAYLPPRIIDREFSKGNALFVIEGEKKALALCDAGVAAVGISGFYGFADKSDELVPELDEVIDWIRPSQIVFAGDSDVVFNAQFTDAALRLRDLLPSYDIRCMSVLQNAPGKGFDDCRAALGQDFLEKCLFESLKLAVPVDASSTSGDLAVCMLKNQLSILGSDARAVSEEDVRHGLVKLAAGLKGMSLGSAAEEVKIVAENLGIARRDFNCAVKDRLTELKRKALVESAPEKATLINLSEQNAIWTADALGTIADDTFVFGGKLVQLTDPGFEEIDAKTLAAFIDDPDRCIFAKESRDGPRKTNLAESNARLILGRVSHSLDSLRPVRTVAEIPTLVPTSEGTKCVTGYHRETEIYAKGESIAYEDLDDDRHHLLDLLKDFSFPSPEDSARAIAFLLAPALVRGGFLGDERCPFFFIEKDEKGAGGGFLCRLVATLYGMKPSPVVPEEKRQAKEDISRALSRGNAFVYLDNVRGNILTKLDFLESMLTEPIFSIRAPWLHGEVDVTREVVAGSSNGAQLSDDLADRTALIRIRKQPLSYQFTQWPEGSLLDHVRRNRNRYLAIVYFLIDRWVREGSPSGKQLSGFRFRRFEEAVQWILEDAFDPQMRLFGSDYGETKRNLADPDYDLLRGILRTVLEQEHPQPVSATDLARISMAHRTVEGDEHQAKMKIGKMMGRYLPAPGKASIGEFTVEMELRNDAATHHKNLKLYSFRRTDPRQTIVSNRVPPRPSFEETIEDLYVTSHEPCTMD
ncbi:MAG: hypothetical protein CMO55_08045 [Verrucomicrobiales bacterium]|nr:hypothetical protein [Verrucomicrobiales bacterium]